MSLNGTLDFGAQEIVDFLIFKLMEKGLNHIALRPMFELSKVGD
jgi:hypothetical protein